LFTLLAIRMELEVSVLMPCPVHEEGIMQNDTVQNSESLWQKCFHWLIKWPVMLLQSANNGRLSSV